MTAKYEIITVDLWFIIRKIFDEDIILYRTWNSRDQHKELAKIYYFKDQALSWLMIAKKCSKIGSRY